MTDQPNRLESQLADLRPRALSPRLADRIADGLSVAPTMPWSDRLLLFVMGSGTLAACTILAILLGSTLAAPRSLPPNVAAVPSIRVGDSLNSYARSRDFLVEIVK